MGRQPSTSMAEMKKLNPKEYASVMKMAKEGTLPKGHRGYAELKRTTTTPSKKGKVT